MQFSYLTAPELSDLDQALANYQAALEKTYPDSAIYLERSRLCELRAEEINQFKKKWRAAQIHDDQLHVELHLLLAAMQDSVNLAIALSVSHRINNQSLRDAYNTKATTLAYACHVQTDILRQCAERLAFYFFSKSTMEKSFPGELNEKKLLTTMAQCIGNFLNNPQEPGAVDAFFAMAEQIPPHFFDWKLNFANLMLFVGDTFWKSGLATMASTVVAGAIFLLSSAPLIVATVPLFLAAAPIVLFAGLAEGILGVCTMVATQVFSTPHTDQQQFNRINFPKKIAAAGDSIIQFHAEKVSALRQNSILRMSVFAPSAPINDDQLQPGLAYRL